MGDFHCNSNIFIARLYFTPQIRTVIMNMNEPNLENTTTPGSPKSDPSPLDQFAPKPKSETGFLGYIREWGDALVIAFVLAMFIRMFVVELFKIPSGSMSPTLLGDFVAEGVALDSNGQQGTFLLIQNPSQNVQVFRKNDTKFGYSYEGRQSISQLTFSQQQLLNQQTHWESHNIIVNKFAYWFKKPDRGDIVIFRVPFKSPDLTPRQEKIKRILDRERTHPALIAQQLGITEDQVIEELHAIDAAQESLRYERNGYILPPHPYRRDQAVYVKRAVALGGERVEIKADNHLYINGSRVEDPEILSQIHYSPTEMTPVYDVKVPENHIIALGDNSENSADSRYWGPLPEENLRGKALLRYLPLRKFGILR